MKQLIQANSETPIAELREVVENRKVYTMKHCELNVFEISTSLHNILFTPAFPSISTILQGKKVIRVDGKEPFEHLPGQGLIMPANTTLSIDFPEASVSYPTKCAVLYVDHQTISEVIAYRSENLPKVTESGVGKLNFAEAFHFNNHTDFVDILHCLINIMRSEHYFFRESLVDTLIRELLIRIIQIQHLESDRSMECEYTDTNRFGCLIQYITNNLTSTLKVEDLCNIVYMSKPSFFRLFKKEFRISPIEYIIKERIQLAKHHLAKASSIKESCFKSGFNNLHYFVRTFKRLEGITPKTYTELIRSSAGLIHNQFLISKGSGSK